MFQVAIYSGSILANSIKRNIVHTGNGKLMRLFVIFIVVALMGLGNQPNAFADEATKPVVHAYLQDVEDLRHMDTAGAGWREADNEPIAIGCHERLPLARPVGGKIVRRQDAIMLRHPTAYASGEFTAVEPTGAMPGNRAIGLRQIGLSERFSFAVG